MASSPAEQRGGTAQLKEQGGRVAAMAVLQDGSRQHRVSRCPTFGWIFSSSPDAERCEEKPAALALRAGQASPRDVEKLVLDSGMASWEL